MFLTWVCLFIERWWARGSQRGKRTREWGNNVDEGCRRVMGKRAKWMEGRSRINRAKLHHHERKCQINSRRIELPRIIGPQHIRFILSIVGALPQLLMCHHPLRCSYPIVYWLLECRENIFLLVTNLPIHEQHISLQGEVGSLFGNISNL
jgi:hypothetical protein